MNAATARLTADQRREEVLEAAIGAFAATGLDGTSAETIARAVGISQPYLFRLFGTKEAFIEAVEWCFRETIDTFRVACRGATSREDAFERMGFAYKDLITDRRKLRLQMQAYAACDDPVIRAVVQRGFGDLVLEIEHATGATPYELAHFLARGMLLNVMASMDVLGSPTGWAAMIQEGCMAELPEGPLHPFFLPRM